MENSEVLISSPIGVLATLAFVAAFFFMLEQTTRAKLFQYIPPLLFIYATPVCRERRQTKKVNEPTSRTANVASPHGVVNGTGSTRRQG